MRRTIGIAALMLIAPLLTACAGGAPEAGVTRPPSDLPINPYDAREAGYTTMWSKKFPVHKDEAIRHVTLLDDVIAVVRVPSNVVSAVAVRDGGIGWHRRLGAPFEMLYEPRRVENRILVNSGIRLYQLALKDGNVDYITKLDYPVSHAPAIFGDFAIYGGTNGMVFAHDIVSGFAKWRYQMPAEIKAAPVSSGFSMFVADTMGVYKMFDASNGQLLWDGRSFAPITGQPALGTMVYVPSHDQTLYALDRNNGSDRWKFRDTEPIVTSPILLGRHLFLPLERGGVVVLGANDGAELWRLEDNALPVTIQGPHVVMYTANSLRWHDLETGRVLKEMTTRPLRKVLPGPADGLLILGADNYMQRIDPTR